MNTIKVKTTQNVAVEYAIASIGDRILAHLIDMGVYFGWFIICSIVLQGINWWQNGNSSVIFSLLLVLPVVFYKLLCEIFMNGQTLGKKARDIRVIKLSGQAPSLGDHLLRWVFRLVDISMSNGLIAIITLAINGKGQRLGDLAAGTSVVRTGAVKRSTFFQVRTEENYQLMFPEVSALTDQDLALIRKLLYKALKYKNEALLQRVAERTREAINVTTNLPDEQFLRQVIKDYHHITSGLEVY